jgi:hypothetical protein
MSWLLVDTGRSGLSPERRTNRSGHRGLRHLGPLRPIEPLPGAPDERRALRGSLAQRDVYSREPLEPFDDPPTTAASGYSRYSLGVEPRDPADAHERLDAGGSRRDDAMTNKTCLRCDWEGETRQARCPNCGVRLYVVAPPSGAEFQRADRGAAASRERVATVDSPPPRSDPPPFPTDPLGSSGRFARFAGAFLLAALLLGVPIGPWLRSHPDRSPRASTDAAVPGSSANDHSSAEVDVTSPTASGSELIVAGVPFSFRASTSGWERFDFSMNKSIMGPQDAEAIVFWSSFPDGDHAIPCDNVLDPQGPSAGDLAAAVASAPGTELVTGPSEVTVGGRVAKHVVLTVREDLGCDPGSSMPGRTTSAWVRAGSRRGWETG